MGIFLLVPGIILLATSGWFDQQGTVGLILTLIGGALIALQLVAASVAIGAVSRASKNGIRTGRDRRAFHQRW